MLNCGCKYIFSGDNLQHTSQYTVRAIYIHVHACMYCIVQLYMCSWQESLQQQEVWIMCWNTPFTTTNHHWSLYNSHYTLNMYTPHITAIVPSQSPYTGRYCTYDHQAMLDTRSLG